MSGRIERSEDGGSETIRASVAAASDCWKGSTADQQVVKRGRDGIDVRALVQRVPLDLLGGRVEWGADERAGAGQVDILGERLRQAKISDLDPSLGIEEAIRRFDIAVNDAELMRLLKPLDHVEDLRDRLVRGERAVIFDEGLERLAGHQLHDDVRTTRLLVGPQNEHAARMFDRAGQAALLAEPFDGVPRGDVLGRDQLQGHPTAPVRVLRLEDGSHAAAAEPANQPVAGHLNGHFLDRRAPRPPTPGRAPLHVLRGGDQCRVQIGRLVVEGRTIPQFLPAIGAKRGPLPGILQHSRAMGADEIHEPQPFEF